MRIFVLAKSNQVTHWAEDACRAFRREGHDVAFAAIRNRLLPKAADALLFDPRFGALRAHAIARKVRDFKPDLVLAIAAFNAPIAVLQAIAALPNRPPLVGWVGDRVRPPDIEAAALFDLVAYTDSSLLAWHRAHAPATQAIFLPHAAPYAEDVTPAAREAQMVFVANTTPHRESVLRSLRSPISLFGPGWRDRTAIGHHRISRRRVNAREIAKIYTRQTVSLNVRNEKNLPNGLNQRHFQPYVYGLPVLTDVQPDLERCFAPGKEVLVWRDLDELNELHDRTRSDTGYAASIAARGLKRIQSEHLFEHRLKTLASHL